MIAYIFKLLNIRLQPYQEPLALSMFISIILNAYSGPMLCKTAVTELPAQWLSLETVWCCICSLLIGMFWKGKFRKAALDNFIVFAVAESVASIGLAAWLVIYGGNVWVYATFSLLYVSVVSMTINKCIMAFKTKIWNEKSRELYDNTSSVVRDLALVIGGTCAMLFCPNLKTSLILWGVACLADDIGWIMTWFKLKNILEEK